MLADTVRDLYRERWGEPTRRAHFEVEEFAIDVLKWDADASPEELPDGLHVEFLQAIPLFDPELEFKRKHGAHTLLRRWEESGVRFWDSDRELESSVQGSRCLASAEDRQQQERSVAASEPDRVDRRS
ncbi:MAG: suppressor of fused domain protein [Solirubrobacteraceae bacterium]